MTLRSALTPTGTRAPAMTPRTVPAGGVDTAREARGNPKRDGTVARDRRQPASVTSPSISGGSHRPQYLW